ncbi:hypothetical protein FIC_00283 [Flavobacteriaceae bacterium 3519-10]|nr:hypothetical protein FIC_00283 [Flavobacteriaceae bacterium 3519-10]
MKTICNILKYLSLVLLIFFLLKLTKHFGDYKRTVYDSILIPITVLLILINILILFKVQKRTKNYRIIKIVFLAGSLGVVIHVITNHFTQKREILTGYMINSKADLVLFKNQTFQITEYSPHIFQYWNGKYTITNDTLILTNIDFEKIPYLRLSQKYTYDKVSGNYIGSESILLKKNNHQR